MGKIKVILILVIGLIVAYPFIMGILKKIPISIYKFIGFVIVVGALTIWGIRFLTGIDKPGKFN